MYTTGQFINPQRPASRSPSNQSIPILLNEQDHLSILLIQLQTHSAKWKEIGTFLGFRYSELENIQAKPFLMSGAPTSWLQEMLANWFQWAPGDSRGSTNFATLEDLKTALNQAGLGATAHDLEI